MSELTHLISGGERYQPSPTLAEMPMQSTTQTASLQSWRCDTGYGTDATDNFRAVQVVRFANGHSCAVGKERWTIAAGGRVIATRSQV